MHAPISNLPVMFEQASLVAGKVEIVREISLKLAPGPATVLLGPNGSGKTTLLRLAMGLAQPTSGRISWGGRTEPGPRLAMMFQRPVMLRRTAASNVAYALPRRDDARVAELLKEAGLSGLAKRPARRLSGGEQQRLALGPAPASAPGNFFLAQ